MFRSRPMFLIALVLLTGGGWYYFFFSPAYPIVNAHPRPGPIIAFGDSLTAGTGARPGESYPDNLERLFHRPILNAGVPGNTIADAAARLDRDVLARRPAIVIVLLGGNDLLQRKDLAQSFTVLETAIRRIQAQGALVVLVDPWMLRIGPYTKRFTRLARATGCPLVPHVLLGILTDANLRSDAIHPNAAGYKIMADRISAVLRPWVPMGPGLPR